MKRRHAFMLPIAICVLGLSACGNKKYDSLFIHDHTYDPSTLEWKWTENPEGGYSVKATATCSRCDENEEGHVLTQKAAVAGPTVVEEAKCNVDGLVSYVASVSLNGDLYYQTKNFATKAPGHHFDLATLHGDVTGHWYECTDCGAIYNRRNHSFGEYSREGDTFYFKRECDECHYEETMFSVNTFDEALNSISVSSVDPYMRGKLEDYQRIYDGLSDEEKGQITHYGNLSAAMDALDDFSAQWDVDGGTFGSLFGNSIPGGVYQTNYKFTLPASSEKGNALSMKVLQAIGPNEGFYLSGFSKDSSYVTGIGYVYSPVETDVTIRDSSFNMEKKVSLFAGWNKIVFDKAEWGYLNTQSQSQIRFTFDNGVDSCDDEWYFCSFYGRLQGAEQINELIANAPSIEEFEPYQIDEIKAIKAQYDGLSAKAKTKVVGYETKITPLLELYEAKYSVVLQTSGAAWYTLVGNTYPVGGLYNNNPGATLEFSVPNTDRGPALSARCKSSFATEAGFYVNGVSYPSDVKSAVTYVYAPEAKQIRFERWTDGDTPTEDKLNKVVTLSQGWNAVSFDEGEWNKLVSSNSHALFITFVDGLQVNVEAYLFTSIFGVRG